MLVVGSAAAPTNDVEAFRPAVAAGNLDPAACAGYRGETSQPADADLVAAVLGLKPGLKPHWEAPRFDGKAAPVHFVIAFKQETPIGTVFVQEGFSLRVLKSGVAGWWM